MRCQQAEECKRTAAPIDQAIAAECGRAARKWGGVIDEALSANAIKSSGYDPARGKPPAPKIAIVACADPRLSSIEQMLGLAEGDADMIRNFGTVIDDNRSGRLSCRRGCWAAKR